MQLCACRCCSQVPLPRITTNTSHHRICRRCAAPCMQLCACRCCSNSPSPSYDNQYLTPPFLQTVRRPLLATLRLPLLFSCSPSPQSISILHTTVFADGALPPARN
jgi:hypothetical protein